MQAGSSIAPHGLYDGYAVGGGFLLTPPRNVPSIVAANIRYKTAKIAPVIVPMIRCATK